MKRAAILILAIATLVLLGSPSAHLLADTATKSASGPAVLAPTSGGTGGGSTGGGTGGGTSEGDADGLSGLKNPGGRLTTGSSSDVERYVITMKMWWRFMLWIR